MKTESQLWERAEQFLDYQLHYRGHSPLTIPIYRTDLRQFVRWLQQRFGEVLLPGEIKKETVMQWAVTMEGLSPSTMRRKVSALSSFFGFLVDVAELAANPAKRIPLPKAIHHIPSAISEKEVERVLAVVKSPFEKAVVYLMLFGGLRRSEVGMIRLEDLDLSNQALLVHGKGAKERMVPLVPQVVAAIQEYLAGRQASAASFLFVSPSGQQLPHDYLNRVLRRIIRRASLAPEKVTPHVLRHTFATHLIRNGVDVRTVQELLGHADLETTAGYLHSDTKSKEHAVEIIYTLTSPSTT